MDKIYKNDVFHAIHEGAVDMYEVGAISDERMKEYDEMCLAAKVPRVSRPARDAADCRPYPAGAPTHR
ncbi:MAG: XRE family transcriptional regulator [Spirochaetaceae bacterium]|nr:XRE family transcriptional regulator [Spirochaetaceae bacterium]